MEQGVIMIVAHEKRRKTPSYTIPFIYEILELMLIWIVVGILEGSLDVLTWGPPSYFLSFIWMGYTVSKLMKVLKRQHEHSY